MGWVKFLSTVVLELAALVFLTLTLGNAAAALVAKVIPSSFQPYSSASFTLTNGSTVTADTPREVEELKKRYQGQITGFEMKQRVDARVLSRSQVAGAFQYLLLAAYVLFRVRDRLGKVLRVTRPLLTLGLLGALTIYVLDIAWGLTLGALLGRLDVVTKQMPMMPLFMSLLVVLIGPIAEELYFRGRLYDLGLETIGRVWTWVAVVVLFAAFHHVLEIPAALASQGPENALRPLMAMVFLFPAYALGGVVFLWLRERSGGLIAPIAAHAGVNFLVLVDLPGRVGLF